MIGLLLAVAVALSTPPTAPPDIPPLRPRPTPPPAVAPATTLARYAEALAATHTPLVLSFEYSVDQAGGRDIQETHRVFRRRDELHTVDGKRVDPPSIHIFLGRRNRYALEALAPRPEAYTFRYLASVHDGKHLDQVFETKPLGPAPATVAQVTIDGITFLPTAIRFVTNAHGGSGTVSFGRIQKYWMAVAASAAATYGKSATVEHLTFTRYRFPTDLAPSTFSTPQPLPTFRPTPF